MVDVPGDASTSAAITVGGLVNGTLEQLGDHDWFKLSLVSGQSIKVLLDGISIEDAYLRIYDSFGKLLYQNDDINDGINRDSQVAFTAKYTGTYFIDVGAFEDSFVGDYRLSVSMDEPTRVGSVDELADHLVSGHWGGDSHRFDVTQGGTLTVNLAGLNTDGKTLALRALQTWGDLIGITFVSVTNGGQIVFSDDEDGAFSDSVWSNGIISTSTVNVAASWLISSGSQLNSYAFQTYIHEIGHALGLGHQGNYNGSADYFNDALYLNDSWAMTTMSYFSQTENTYFADQGFSYNYALTPMMADIAAIQKLYGLSTTTRAGDTAYGVFATDILYNTDMNNGSVTIFDSGGNDWINYYDSSADQVLNLNPETFSNVAGKIGNLSIGRGVIIENAVAGSGNDRLIGNSANNWLNGNGGDDFIDGGGGDDRALYTESQSAVTVDLSIAGPQETGSGRDTLVSIEQLVGSMFADVLRGNHQDNYISGAGGDDAVYGGGGADNLIGASGNDALYGEDGADNLDGGYGEDRLFGGAGADILIGDRDKDMLDGGDGDDLLLGGDDDDLLIGGAGNDSFRGSFGQDVFDGGLGSDRAIYEDAGAAITVDLATGIAESTVYYSAGFGIDELNSIEDVTGGAYDDTLLGGADVNHLDGLGGADVIDGRAGSDILDGGAGDDRLIGRAGDDRLIGGLGYDRLYGGIGDDTYVVTDLDDYAYENAGEGYDGVIASVDHQLRLNIESLSLIGSALIGKGNVGDNLIIGSSAGNKLYGLNGNDTLEGAGGDDYLLGGEGDDLLTGGSGHDRMYGGLGNDRFIVSDLADYAYENPGEGNDRVIASINHQLRANIETLELSGNSDLRGFGNALDNQIFGNSGANLLYGRDGGDSVYGNGGADILYGESGSDTLFGGSGLDRFYGGSGADLFSFAAGDFAGMSSSTADRLHDFTQAQGDRIGLALIDANSIIAGDQDFSFIGTGAFTGAAGQLRYQQISGNSYVQGDLNGDGVADFWIRIDGIHTLSAGDFIF